MQHEEGEQMTVSAFVDTTRLAVTDGENTIYIKPRMDYGTWCRVRDTLARMAIANGQVGELHVTTGSQELALAVHNVIGWDGPAFVDPMTKRAVPCTPENIERLERMLPVFIKAREKINEVNTDAMPDPNALTAGSQSSMVRLVRPAEVMTST